MIGVTVSTPKYAALSKEAVARWKRFTGLDVLVIECADREAFMAKMKLDLLAPREKCVFFDADWWAIRPLDFGGWHGDAWLAVHDPGVFHPRAFCRPDCDTMGLDPGQYFNSGFFAWNNACGAMRRVFQIARQHEHDAFRGEGDEVLDFGEQSRLNLGVQRSGIPLSLLPAGMNFMRFMVQGRVFPYIPALVHAVHAAGVKLPDKWRHLQAASDFLSYDLDTSQEGERAARDASLWHQRQTFDMR
jgi:hypothetical protein